jgi:transcriptional regulator with XRE-family HTH domain
MMHHSSNFVKPVILQAFSILIIMSLSDNMLLIRKKKGISQAELGKLIGTSGDVIGRYERGDISPSVEVVSKIADALEVSVDYLLGKTKMELDKQALKRLEDIASLAPENRSFVLNLIDMALRDFKVKKAHAS